MDLDISVERRVGVVTSVEQRGDGSGYVYEIIGGFGRDSVSIPGVGREEGRPVEVGGSCEPIT